jgi:hypothetical protein
MRPTMKMIKHKIIAVIQNTDGLPNYTQREYLKFIRSYLLDGLSENEMTMLRKNKINLDKWILEITHEITEDLF